MAAGMTHPVRVLGTVGAYLWVLGAGFAGWSWRHTRYIATLVAVAAVLRFFGHAKDLAVGLLALGWVVPAFVTLMWAYWWPISHERFIAGPTARFRWVRWAKRAWRDLALGCDLGKIVHEDKTSLFDLSAVKVDRYTDCRLVDAHASGYRLVLTIRSGVGCIP